MQQPDHGAGDAPDHILREAHARFGAAFAHRCATLSTLFDTGDTRGLITELHRLAGVAGMVGFPAVSESARTVEDLLRDAAGATISRDVMTTALLDLRSAFDRDCASEPPAWLPSA